MESYSLREIFSYRCQARTILDALDILPVAVEATHHIHPASIATTITCVWLSHMLEVVIRAYPVVITEDYHEYHVLLIRIIVNYLYYNKKIILRKEVNKYVN